MPTAFTIKHNRTRRLACFASIIAMAAASQVLAQSPSTALNGLEALYPSLNELYTHLHKNPELSFFEEKTAATMAQRLRALGYEVTEKVGGHGLVGLLRNGGGPTVLLRTDMDARQISLEAPNSQLFEAPGLFFSDLSAKHASQDRKAIVLGRFRPKTLASKKS